MQTGGGKGVLYSGNDYLKNITVTKTMTKTVTKSVTKTMTNTATKT